MKEAGIDFEIKEKSESQALLEITFLPEYTYFNGHFEDFKLLAALIQIKVAIDFANEVFPIQLNPSSIPKMKFSNPICPNKKINLKLSFDSSSQKVCFQYFDELKSYSIGDMRL